MNHFDYHQKDIDFTIDIFLIENTEEILIRCNYSEENKYLSLFNLEKLKNIDILFGGFPPLPISEIYQLLRIYFKENTVSIIEVSNSKVIIEIEKDVKPNMRFELKKDQNNFLNNNNNSIDKNYTQVMINKKNNYNMIYNESKINNNTNNNGNMNNNNMVFTETTNYNNDMKCNNNLINNNMNYNGNMNNNNMNYNENMNNNNNNMNCNGYINNNNMNYNENNMIYNENMNNNNNTKNNYNINMNNNNNNNINYNGNNNKNNYNRYMNNNYNNNINFNGNNNNNYIEKINKNNNNNNINNENNNYNMNLNENINNYYENVNNNQKNYNENNNNNNKYNNNNNNHNNGNINIINNYKNNNYKNNNPFISNIINNEMQNLLHTGNRGGLDNINLSNNNTSNKDNISFCQNSFNNNENEFNILNQNSSSLNVRVARPKNNYIDRPLNDLNCLLKFFLIKMILNKKENISNNKNAIPKDAEEVLKIFSNINDSKNFKNDTNILEYLKYLDNIDLDLNLLINNLFRENQEVKNEIVNYWKFLSKYEEYNNDFEHQLFEDLKNCHFDYSLVNMNILERNNPEEYEYKKKECKNMKKMILYYFSENNYDSNKLNMELVYSNKSIYGKGFYFSDSIDYIISYQNEENAPKIGENFSLLAFEIFYDEEKLEEFDINLDYSSQNNISNTEEKIKPNGLKKIINFHLNNNNSKRILNTEYVLSEKYQIFPLYTFTLRRNEYFVLYRDPNFKGQHNHSIFLKNLKIKSIKYSKNMNFYFESSTEEALKLLLNKKKEKVILVTSIRYDKSGKRFAEIVRKILNFDLIVLFFSNNANHFNWIKDFPNCLYTSKSSIYEYYISNYNEVGLKEIKKKVEDLYSIKLKEFTFDFICYSNCDDDLSFSIIDYNINCQYFKTVNIINPNKFLYLSMTTEGKVKKSEEECLWEITIFDNTITLFSNGFYLDIDKSKEIAKGAKEMKKWNFCIIDDYYYFINTEKEKNNILSMEDDENIRVNQKDFSKNSLFKLNEVIFN